MEANNSDVAKYRQVFRRLPPALLPPDPVKYEKDGEYRDFWSWQAATPRPNRAHPLQMKDNENLQPVVQPDGIPPEAVAFLQEVGYFDAERLTAGDHAPPLKLKELTSDDEVTIGGPTDRPTVLIFGSYT